MSDSHLPPIFDTHVHYNLEPLWPNWQNHWQKAQEHGVVGSIVVGTNLETSARALEIAAAEPKIKAALGIHPSEWSENQNLIAPAVEKIAEMIAGAQNEQVVAIGEIGLDYYWLNESKDGVEKVEKIKATQKKAFIAQLELATKQDLPVILHVRDKIEAESPTPNNAYWDTLEIIKKNPPRKFVLHCFSGPQAYLDKMIALGAFVGVDGNITYPNAGALREKIKTVPTERILIETDAPYLAPQKYRGQVCEPFMIEETAKAVESLVGLILTANWTQSLIIFPEKSP